MAVSLQRQLLLLMVRVGVIEELVFDEGGASHVLRRINEVLDLASERGVRSWHDARRHHDV